jgi:LPXTG-motif cell wall-anchored protein
LTDADGLKNGEIDDPGALATTSSGGGGGGSGGGGGACFISTAAGESSSLWLELMGLLLGPAGLILFKFRRRGHRR